MSECDVAFTALDLDASERFQSLRRELGVTTFGINLSLLTFPWVVSA